MLENWNDVLGPIIHSKWGNPSNGAHPAYVGAKHDYI